MGDNSWNGHEHNSLLYNTEDKKGGTTFVEMADGLGLGDAGDGRAVAFGDFDLDGDTDIVLSRYRQKNALYMNELGDKNNFIAFRLQGESNNLAGIGAIITVEGEGAKSAQQVTIGSGFSSQSSTEKIFGLGSKDGVSDVMVLWPGGARERFGAFAKNQRHVLKKGQGKTEIVVAAPVKREGFSTALITGLAALMVFAFAGIILARRRA